MKLYYLPGACSFVPHVALEWIGEPYEAQAVSREQLKSADYLALNPQGAVPLLVDGDLALTQNVAILSYLDELYPQAELFGSRTNGSPITDDGKYKVGMNSYRFGQLTKKGGIWEGQQIPVIWESKVAMGAEKGTIQNMLIDYITNVKGGKIDGKSHNRWKIVGL